MTKILFKLISTKNLNCTILQLTIFNNKPLLGKGHDVLLVMRVVDHLVAVQMVQMVFRAVVLVVGVVKWLLVDHLLVRGVVHVVVDVGHSVGFFKFCVGNDL